MEWMPVNEMTDRQIAEQTLELMRAFTEILQSIGSNPMAAMMMPGFAGRFGG